jgi:aspartyl-tRNA(Asn)/glutamyl-tRNA(Gln) amidotransferase subunit C
MAVLTTEQVLHVARLARLRLEGPALSRVAAQLDEILQYVQQLGAVPTEGVEPTSHVLPLTNVLRADEPQPAMGQETVTGLAPAAHGAFVSVPKVIDA